MNEKIEILIEKILNDENLINKIAECASFEELYDTIKNIDPKLNKSELGNFMKECENIDMNKLEYVAGGLSDLGKKSSAIVLSALLGMSATSTAGAIASETSKAGVVKNDGSKVSSQNWGKTLTIGASIGAGVGFLLAISSIHDFQSSELSELWDKFLRMVQEDALSEAAASQITDKDEISRRTIKKQSAAIILVGNTYDNSESMFGTAEAYNIDWNKVIDLSKRTAQIAIDTARVKAAEKDATITDKADLNRIKLRAFKDEFVSLWKLNGRLYNQISKQSRDKLARVLKRQIAYK